MLNGDLQNKATIKGNVEFNNISVGNSDIALIYSIDDNVNFRYKETSGSQNWTNISDIVSSINNLRSSFQDGCNAIYNQCVITGITPSSNSPDAICTAITSISNTAYTNGYNGGYNEGFNAGKSAASGSYTITFLINAHDNESPMNWLKYNDQITLNIANNTATLGAPSFMNAQIRSEFGEYYNIKKN